jgi:hypothetical protein
MPFEPSFPGPYQYLFHGHMQAQVTDPHGTPAPTIISLTDDWHLQVNWQVHGLFVPSICGTWQIRAYLESIGPGPELLVANRDVAMTGANTYSQLFFIGPNIPSDPGPYKLVTVITSLNALGTPAPFAGYDEGQVLQFYEGPSLPPVPPMP